MSQTTNQEIPQDDLLKVVDCIRADSLTDPDTISIIEKYLGDDCVMMVEWDGKAENYSIVFIK